mgnify:CR=1 FL=1
MERRYWRLWYCGVICTGGVEIDIALYPTRVGEKYMNSIGILVAAITLSVVAGILVTYVLFNQPADDDESDRK